MKFLTYNLWCGTLIKELSYDLATIYDSGYDIVFFQEVTSFPETSNYVHNSGHLAPDLQTLIRITFFDYKCYFVEQFPGFGTMTLIKPGLEIDNFEVKLIQSENVTGNWPQCFRFATSFTINNNQYIHVHGLWTPEGKIDCDQRFLQSERLIKMIKRRNCLLIGDLNYHDELKCLLWLECHLVNQNKVFGIKSTRSIHYKKDIKQADYVLTKGAIDCSLQTLDFKSSDHLPLSFSCNFN